METKSSQENALTTTPVNPNALHSDVVLVLMTRQAQRLVHGRRGYADDKQSVAPIIGLFKFAALVHLIWRGGMRDDPYADMWLLRVENTLRTAREELSEISGRVDQALDKMPEGVQVSLAVVPEPMRLELRFSNPYNYQGAYLLGHYDRLVRHILTAHHVGALSTQLTKRQLNAAGRCVRRAFVKATGYHFLGVTRTDLRAGNNRARVAVQQMGALPEYMLKARPRLLHMPTTRPLVRKEQEWPAQSRSVAPNQAATAT